MNRIFRIIWSQALNTWVVVSELATRRGKRSGGAEVDERVAPQALTLDRDVVEGSPPATEWPLRIGILLALLSLYAPADAANRYWDVNGTAVGRGGTGTWNTTSAFWSPNNDGVSGPFSPWSNAALDDAFFGGTAGTVTLGTPITVHNLTFETTGYTLSGGTLTLGGVTPTITVNSGVNATINSAIAGTAGLTKAGGGNLTLNGVNTFTGTVNVGGTSWVYINGDAALGAAGNNITLANGAGLSSTGALNTGRVLTLLSGTGYIAGGVGSARITGTGNLNVGANVTLGNNTNDYTGQTIFGANGSFYFGTIADLGVASALGAPTTVANGTIRVDTVDFGASAIYTGAAASSNRDWQLISRWYGSSGISNSGTGTLTLTGNISGTYTNGTFAAPTVFFNAQTADIALTGVISGSPRYFSFQGSGSNRTITLGGANTFTPTVGTSINNVTVKAGVLANTGVASSLGTSGGVSISNNGVLSYTGAGASSDRAWGLNNGTINNDGTGALVLSGTLGLTNTGTLGGSYIGSDNLFSGVISGAGNLAKSGASTWVISGANTYTGSTIVNSGVLRAGSATAFGASSGAVVNGGTLDLNDFNTTLRSLAGTGGSVDLGTGTLTLDAPAATSTSYAGNITGSGGLTKNGASTQTLTGANTYTGATTVNGGTLRLDFSTASAPTSNIISGASALNMGGGTLSVIGAAGEANAQTFNGLFVSAGNNTIGATSGTGGSMTVNLGTITRTGGLVNFLLPVSGNITTASTTLGGWATVNGTDYAKVVDGNIVAFTNADYTDKDEAATWLSGEFISDSDGDAESFSGTVGSSIQLGGLQFTTPDATTTINVAAGQTLGIDGTIIVAPSVLGNNQTITGGSITGMSGGGVLGIQQNSTGNFTIASQIVDNGGSIGFTKAGTGLVTLSNTGNTYTGATTVSQGILSVASIANGGVASSIGASSSASSNLFLEGGTLRYTGGTTSSDRGFTIAKSGAILGSGVEVTSAATNLTFSGLVTSTDGANFTKSGAGTLTLSNASNDYTGSTTVSGGTLAVSTLANGGLVSSIGASSSASSNLVLNGGTLMYDGGTTSTDRGFTVGTLGAGGASGGIGVSNAATTLTVSGTAIGDDGFRKEGAGTLVLSGTNTYTGGTTVNAGTLRAGSTQAFGSATNATTVAAGATLDLNGFNNTIGVLNGSGAVTLGTATLTSSSGGGTFTGVISGSGGFTRSGGFAVAQTMTGCNNTYTGVTHLNGGIISVDCLANGGLASGIGASTSASSSLLFNSGVLRYTGGSINSDRGFTAQSGPAAIDVTNAATTLGLSGSVVGGGLVRKDGAGTLVLSGNNTYTGGTQVTGGILRAGSATAFGNGYLQMDNTAGGTLDLNGFNASFSWLQGGGANGGNINLGAQTLTVGTGHNTAGIYAGRISGTGNLIKNGAQIQRLSGCSSSYTGTTTINSGTLSVDCLGNGGGNSGIGASDASASNLVINGGATLSYLGAGHSSDRLFTLGTGVATLDASGTGALQLTNTGAIALSGTNAARTLTLTGTNTGNNTLSAQLDNNGTGLTSLTKAGTGTWILTNNNSSYTGVTTINGGVLGVSKLANGGLASGIGAASSAASNLVLGNGSTLRYTGAGDSTDRLFTLASGVTFIESSGTGAINFTNTGAVTLANPGVARTIALGGTYTGNNTLGGAIGDAGAGVTTLAKNDAGTWILTGNNTYTGNTVINSGNLVIGNGGTTGNLGTGNVIVDSAASTLSINRSDTVIFNATMSGPGTFAQTGTGTTTLTSLNSSIGATTISAGTLDVNGVLTTGAIGITGTSTLNVDGTVQASGGTASVLTGDAGASTVNVNGGATLRANGSLGDGIDSLTLAGTLDTGASALSLGLGNDTLRLNDGATLIGFGVDGGGGTDDNLLVNNALAMTFGGTGVSGFEKLSKQNTGTLTLTGAQSYSAGTAIDGGTLDVNGTLETSTVSMTSGTTLNVDGTVQGLAGTTTSLTGSTGVDTINVNGGATLRANGDLGDGVDNVTLFGTLDTGASMLNLGAGDETFTLRDGAVLTGAGIDAGTGSDDLVLDNAQAMLVDGNTIASFEALIKQGSGVATLTGTQTFTDGTAINGGTLDLDGSVVTPTVTLADNTTLNVDGSLAGTSGTAAAMTGSSGDNTVTVNGSLLANGDLGAGNDVLDVVGTLDTDGGTFDLGDGDDTLSIHDGTTITGTVAAGAGNDTFNTDISTTADLGAVQGFETLSKTGSGTLNVNGPASSDFSTVNVTAGELNVMAGGTVAAAPDGTLTTTVASGATLNVDGNYGCGANSDTMNVSGTVSGTGTIDLCDGDDTLTLNDGAVVSANTLSGGAGTGDTVVLNNAGDLTFGGTNVVDFEVLQKDNTGVATLAGSQGYTAVNLNQGTLTVADGATLTAPTLTMADGTVFNVGGFASGGLLPSDAITLTGSSGVNTVTIADTAQLVANGDLGAGNDVLDVAGTLAGTSFNFGTGNDRLVVHENTSIQSAIDAGADVDLLQADIAAGTAVLGDLSNFEELDKTNLGTLQITGDASFFDVDLLGGTLDVASGSTVSAQDTSIASGATLDLDGNYSGTTGGDVFTVAGTVAGAGNLDLLDGDDSFTILDGADLSGLTNAVDGGTGVDTLTADLASTATLGGAINFETLIKSNVGTLNIDSPTASSQFDTVLVQGGTLFITAGTIVDPQTTVVSSGATMTVDGTYFGTTGADTFTVAGTVNGTGTIDLLDGDDTLTLNDGADLSGLANPLDGGAHGGGDTVVLGNTGALSLSGGSITNFEFLQKNNTGTATLTGTQSFSGGTTIEGGTLDVDGTLNTTSIALSEATTLNVDGTVQDTGATQTSIAGSAGSETVSVGTTGTLLATGDLGADNDVLDVAGTLDTSGGTFALGDGDDTFTVHDGSNVIGTIDGGAGLDTRVYDINGIANLGALLNFEGITKTGTGTLNINGPGTTSLLEVDVLGGTLHVATGATLAAQDTTVSSGSTLDVDGTYTGTTGNDVMTVAGTVTGDGTIDLLGGDDTFTIQDGANLSTLANAIDGGDGTDTFLADLTGSATLGGAINFETLTKTNAGTLNIDGPEPSSFTTVNVNGGTLDVGAGGSVEGVVNTTVASGATLNVDGTYLGSSGGDLFIVSGTVAGAGTINLAGGEDQLLLRDGADLSGLDNPLDGGDDPFIADAVVLENTGALTLSGDSVVNFESLQKFNAGTATLTGTHTYSTGVSIWEGSLDVDGTLNAAVISLGDGTALNVDGTVQDTGATQTLIGGNFGSERVSVGAAGTLRATGDLDFGDDVLDVAGTLDTGSGTFALGDGNDTLTIHDGTTIIGTVDAGAGSDTLNTDISTTADLGAVQGFEALSKTGTGTLNVNGPSSSDFSTVDVLAGVLNIGAGGSIVAGPGGMTTTVASDATLNVDGSYGCGNGNDTMNVSGTVSGTGTIDLCGGDDTLTLNDGAVLANVIDGGANGAGDTVFLNSALALVLDAGNTVNFEFLQKDNIGTATLTGTQGFSGGTTINGGTLDVDGTLETPTVAMGDDTTLNVDGSLQGAGGSAATITGSDGVNTVTVDGTLLAAGDLGAGNDVLDVTGTLDTLGGTFALGDGDDSFVVHDGTNVIGIIDGGAGLDTRVYDINGIATLGELLNFEGITKTGTGILNINGPGTTSLDEVDVLGGTLHVGAGATLAAQDTVIATGTTLNVDGAYTGTTGNDTMVVAGTVTGAGTVDLLDGDDTFTIQDGADLSGLANAVDGGAGTDTFIADLGGSATLGGAINFETLTKTNTGTLNIDGAAPSAFTTVNIDGGTVDVGVGGSVDGVVTTTVASGATLNVDGSYTGSAGTDTFDVSGTVSGGGTIDLADGDDTLTLNDGAVLNNVIDGGGHGTGDTVVLNNAGALSFDASNTVNFEFLQKDNIGTATLTGTQNFSGGTAINGGTLDVDGALETPTVTLADDTTLNVDGSLQGTGGTAATITGSDGVNTVNVNGTVLADGDLGAGNDVLDVVGTLDTGGGTFALGDGDDSFIVHDGTNVVGTVDGGAGLDTRVYDINLNADLGALVNFEGVTKTGTGTLNINGPTATDLQEVSVLGGTLNIAAGASVIATPGSSLDTVVASGATLNVDGSYGCGDGNDTMDVSGTVSGTGTIDLCGGDDTLTLNDGAVLNNVIDGGANGTGDTVVLNNAGAMTLDAGSTTNFEILRKDNTGVATLTGTQSFSGGTTINGGTLDVDGTLETPTVAMGDDTTLNVDGSLQGVGGTAATITGSDGVNTVTVDGTLLANGDLGAGNDVLDVAGTLDTAGGTFALGDGDDRFIVHDTTAVFGTVDAGAGTDLLEVNVGAGNTVPLGALSGFESLGKSGLGTLQINGPSSFIDVEVLGGTLDVAATGSVAAQNTTVFSGATLNLDGSYTGTAGNDSFTVAGTVTGAGTVDLLDGDDTFTIQDGADLSGLANSVDGGAGTDTFVADLAGSATLGGAVNFETLTKTNTGTLNIDGLAPSAFTTVNVDGGTLDIGTGGSVDGVVTTTVASGATLSIDGSYAGSSGDDTMTVAGIVTGSGTVNLGDGNDALTLQDGADMSGLQNALDGGAGTDTVSAQVSSTMTLGPTVNFETLQKGGTGELTLDGDQAYVTTQIDAGSLTVAAGTTLTSQDTTIAADATLDVQGTFTGTAGDDSFTSRGTVSGALGFADGNDTVEFIGGDISGLTGLDGGAGGSDDVSFSGLSIDSNDLSLTGWERVELLDDSMFALSDELALGGGVLAIDATSQLDVNAGASIGGSVENAGLINVGANRLSISGGYSANDAALQLTVSPSNATSGGLDIAGDVTGNTAITFDGDGTEVLSPQEPTSILVISSPNDDLATAGGFTAANAVDGVVRVTGSVQPWSFGQHGDKNWYLETEAAGVLPEIGGYAVLPSIGQASIQDNNRLLFQRMAAVRSDASQCGASDPSAYAMLTGDCHGFWVAAGASELQMGANPGFEFSGDNVSLYTGVDLLLQDRGSRTFRGGLFAGFQRGTYWTTGVNSTELQGISGSNVQLDTPSFGMYGSFNWRGATYLDLSLTAQLPNADVVVADGFQEEISGSSLTLSAQMGHRFQLANGWTVEPQVQLSASAMQWSDTVDASGKELVLDDDLLGTARVAVHVEKAFETAGGARIRPWLTLGLHDTVGEKQSALNVMATGASTDSVAFPNHELGLGASLDVGVEAELNKSVSLFGALSYGESLEGSDSEQRQANVGVRIRW